MPSPPLPHQRVQVYNPVVVSAYPERLLDEYQNLATVGFFLIRGLTIPAIFLLSIAVSLFSVEAVMYSGYCR